MVLALCVPARAGERVRGALLRAGLLDTAFRPRNRGGRVWFALKKRPPLAWLKALETEGACVEEAALEPAAGPPPSLAEALRGVLSPAERAALVTSFDVIGDIAVLEVPERLRARQAVIARALMASHPSVRTVCRIAGETQGPYRVRPVRVIAGSRRLLTEHREHGCRFRVEVGKVFFSPRLSFERGRIASLVQEGETVGAFFAGVGPYPIVLAKKTPLKKAVAIELNSRAVALLRENVALNRVQDRVEVLEGDVRAVAPRALAGACDRVVMPLPHGAGDFLDTAMACLRPRGGVVHFYHAAPRHDPFGEARRLAAKNAARAGFASKVVLRRVVRSFTPAVVQVVLDVACRPAHNT